MLTPDELQLLKVRLTEELSGEIRHYQERCEQLQAIVSQGGGGTLDREIDMLKQAEITELRAQASTGKERRRKRKKGGKKKKKKDTKISTQFLPSTHSAFFCSSCVHN